MGWSEDPDRDRNAGPSGAQQTARIRERPRVWAQHPQSRDTLTSWGKVGTPLHTISITDGHWYSLVNPRGLSVDICLIHSARETRPQTMSCQQNHTPTITDKAPVLNHSHPMLYEISKSQNSMQTSNMPTWAPTRHLPLETISLLLVT